MIQSAVISLAAEDHPIRSLQLIGQPQRTKPIGT